MRFHDFPVYVYDKVCFASLKFGICHPWYPWIVFVLWVDCSVRTLLCKLSFNQRCMESKRRRTMAEPLCWLSILVWWRELYILLHCAKWVRQSLKKHAVKRKELPWEVQQKQARKRSRCAVIHQAPVTLLQRHHSQKFFWLYVHCRLVHNYHYILTRDNIQSLSSASFRGPLISFNHHDTCLDARLYTVANGSRRKEKLLGTHCVQKTVPTVVARCMMPASHWWLA